MTADKRTWRIVSDCLANDPEPYTTQQLFDYADQCNREHEGDADWTPFELHDGVNEIVDLSHQRGDEGYIAAVLFDAF